MLLALIGGGIGLMIAFLGLDLLLAISPSDLPRLDQITIDRRVLGFTLGVSLLTGLIFGLVPALQASKADLTESLKEGGRGSSVGLQGKRIRSGLVVFEVATTLVLLISAGLMIKSFMNLQDVKLGFNPDRLLTVRLQLSGTKYRENVAATNFLSTTSGARRSYAGSRIGQRNIDALFEQDAELYKLHDRRPRAFCAERASRSACRYRHAGLL